MARTRPHSSRKACATAASTSVVHHGSGQNGRTSIVPIRATGCFEATSIASSRSAHSSRSKPPICSFVSAYGPSETNTSLDRTRTVVASAAGSKR